MNDVQAADVASGSPYTRRFVQGASLNAVSGALAPTESRLGDHPRRAAGSARKAHTSRRTPGNARNGIE
jgi:hypothetical protein